MGHESKGLVVHETVAVRKFSSSKVNLRGDGSTQEESILHILDASSIITRGERDRGRGQPPGYSKKLNRVQSFPELGLGWGCK